MRLYIIGAGVLILLIAFGGTFLAGRNAGSDAANTDHLTDTLKGKVANDDAINRAKNAGRDAVAADPDCLSDPYCRD